MSFWSWLSASENVTSWPAAPEIASTAASAASVAAGVARSDVTDADIGGFSWVDVEEGVIGEQVVLEAGEFLGLVAASPALSRRKPGGRRGILQPSQGPGATPHKSCL